MRPCQAFHALESLEGYPSVPLMRKGSVLSDRDSRTVREVYQQWLLLCIDLGYLTPDTLLRTGRRLWLDMNRVDVLDLNSSFAECLQLVRLQNSKGFKGLCLKISPHLYSLIKNDIGLLSQGNVFAATRLTQLFSYTSRLSLQDIDLTQQLLEDYLRIEAELPSQYPDVLVHSLNKIMRRWIGSFAPLDDIVPKHGPGSVADSKTKALEAKYKCLASDSLLVYGFGQPDWCCIDPDQTSFDRVSKTIFVPKSYKTFRTISMEPTTLQYFQQGVWNAIDRQVSRSRYLKNRIGFHDQERNKQLAREGSSLRNYATLDLSAASDSVSYDLVKKVFKGTWLLRYIVITRSRETDLPNGERIRLRKFAPMGSALCFPIETLIFAAVCEHVTRVCDIAGDFSVFGDDIILPTQCVDLGIRCLTNLGFRVNREKSFADSTCWFRESCGGEYFDGFDATPMRVSRKYASRRIHVRVQELIDLANAAKLRRFKFLRQFFVRKLLDVKVVIDGKSTDLLPHFADTSLRSDNYTNYRSPKRWNRNLQRIEVLAHVERASYLEEDLLSQDESIRYRHWLESTHHREHLGEGFQSVICRPITSIKPRWVSKPYELTDHEYIAVRLPSNRS